MKKPFSFLVLLSIIFSIKTQNTVAVYKNSYEKTAFGFRGVLIDNEV